MEVDRTMKYKRFPLGPLWTNTYLVWEAGKGFLVDPAGDPDQIAAFAQARGVSIEKILLTHGHLDHAGGLPAVMERFKAPVYVPEKDASMVASPDPAALEWMGYDFSGTDDFSPLRDGDVLSVGEMRITVLATPGHTPGSSCYLAESGEGSFLLSGDTLFARSVGRTDLPGGDPGMLDRSILRLGVLPDGLQVLPGHGPETTIGAERKHNPFWPDGEIA
jgi:glyoxylase-like metal-dependent hydrolase (beta-lactamase superfamily II)